MRSDRWGISVHILTSSITTLIIIVALSSAACSVSTGTALQEICTVDDPNCGDPGGGVDQVMFEMTDDYSDTIVSSYNQPATKTWERCGRGLCIVFLDFGSFQIKVVCEEVVPGWHECRSAIQS